MKRNIVFLGFCAVMAWSWLGIVPADARDNHAHDHGAHEEHNHDDHEDYHDDDEHDHEDHEEHGHDEHGHDEHEEGKTEISPDAAKKSGIKIATVGMATIDEHITLTGRINKNRNTTISVPARFPSIVKEVYVSWGDKVEKGQLLAVLESRSNLKPYKIIAPRDGVVLERNISAGDLTEDEALFVIADLSDVWAEFHVFPRDLARIREKQHVHVKALESEREDTASISMILPTADAYSQTVIAIVTLPNKEGRWRPGMMVEGDVHLAGDEKKSLVVTEKAVQRMEEKTVIFVQEGNEYEMRPVVLGRRDGHHVEVLEGLKEGERYVSEGSFIVKADIGKQGAGHDHAH